MMTSPLYVGIDVSSKNNVVCCLTRDDEKQPLTRFTITNNRPGIKELQDRITKLVKKHGYEQLLFGLEHSIHYSTHAVMYLHHHLDFGVPEKNVYVFNPSLIKQFKKFNYLDSPENDRAGAWFIAANLGAENLPHPFTWSEPQIAL